MTGAEGLKGVEAVAQAFLSWKADLSKATGADLMDALEADLSKPPSSKNAMLAVHEVMACDLIVRSKADPQGVAKQIPGFHTFGNRTLGLTKKDCSPKVTAILDKIAKDRVVFCAVTKNTDLLDHSFLRLPILQDAKAACKAASAPKVSMPPPKSPAPKRIKGKSQP